MRVIIETTNDFPLRYRVGIEVKMMPEPMMQNIKTCDTIGEALDWAGKLLPQEEVTLEQKKKYDEACQKIQGAK